MALLEKRTILDSCNGSHDMMDMLKNTIFANKNLIDIFIKKNLKSVPAKNVVILHFAYGEVF